MGANTVSVLLNQGSGTFGTKVDYTTGSGPYSVAVVDVNGDGKPDIVTANQNSNTVSVLINQGSGTFGTKVDYATGSGSVSVAVVDVNGDGKPDIVTANAGASTASVLLGTCSGIAEAGVSCTSCSTNQYTTDHITCQNCTAGNYLNVNPGSSCTPCAVGYYNPGVGYGTSSSNSTACTPCPVGTVSTVVGANSSSVCLTITLTTSFTTSITESVTAKETKSLSATESSTDSFSLTQSATDTFSQSKQSKTASPSEQSFTDSSSLTQNVTDTSTRTDHTPAPTVEPFSMPAVLDLETLGSGSGIKITTVNNAFQTGYLVSGIGDINGDGISDVCISKDKLVKAFQCEFHCLHFGIFCCFWQ